MGSGFELAVLADESSVWDPEDFVELLGDMQAAGHEPGDWAVARWGDGRIRVFPGTEAHGRLRALENEQGQAEIAYRVGLRDGQPMAEELSRKSAIFLASLGMTTGALPNVEVSLSPEGVSNSPVW